MRTRVVVFGWIITLSMLSSCSDEGPTAELRSVQSQISQVPGCAPGSLAKTASDQTCFSYTFTTNLDVTWCLPGNCCPDSGRFIFSSSIIKDTVTVLVKDTAANQCRCICTYNVRATYSGLPLDRYLVLVRLADSTFYRETVYRTR